MPRAPGWTDEVDELIRRARYTTGTNTDAAAAVLRDGVSPAAADFLALVGLAELTSQSFKWDRDATAPCAGDTFMRAKLGIPDLATD